MQTHSSSRLVSNPSSNPTPSTNPNPKDRNRRRSKQRIKDFNLEELSPPIVTMANQRTMAQLLQALEGYEDAIVVPAITADNVELKHFLLTLVQNKQFFGHDKEDPHAHVRYFNKITSTLKFPNVPNTFKDLLRTCPHHGFLELHQLDTFYNALNSKDQDSLKSTAGGNFLDKMPRECLAIIESKPKVCYSRNKPVVAKVSTNTSTSGISPDVAKLKDMGKALLLDKKGQNQSPAPVKEVEESCVTCGGAHSYRNCPATDGNVYRDNIQEFVSQASAVKCNQGNTRYHPPMMSNQIRPPGFHLVPNNQNVQLNQRNNQNHFIPNQNQGNNFNQGPVYQPLVFQPPAYQAPAYQALAPETQGVSKEDFSAYVKANDTVMRNMQTQGQNMQNQLTNLTDLITNFVNSDSASTSSSSTLPSNTIANPRSDLKAITTRSGVSYDGPQIPPPPSFLPKVVENEPEVTKDTMNPTNNKSTEDVQPQPNPKSSIPYPSRRNDERNHEKANNQIEKFYQIFKDMSFKISFADALILIPKFASTLKALIGNKEKLSEMARTPLNEHCSAVLLKKLPKKLGDPGKFLIPCNFPELPDHSISQPVGVAEDVYVKVGSFHFLADFVVVDFDADPRVPLILGRSFLKTGRALIDVFEGKLTLRIGKEAITFNLDQTSRYSANYSDMTAKRIDVIDMACEEYSEEVLGFSDTISSGNPTPYYDSIVSTTSLTLTPFRNSDFLLKELPEVRKELKICKAKSDKSSVDEPPAVELKDLPPHIEYAFLEGDDKLPVIIAKYLSVEEKTALIMILKSHKRAIAWKLSDKGIDPEFYTHKILMDEDFEQEVQHQRRVNPKIHDVIKQEGGFTVVENEDNELIPTRLVTSWHVFINYQKMNEATSKDHFPLPFMDQMLERLAGNQYYYFLDDFSGYFQISIDPKDQEKTTFTCPYRTFAYRRMPFGLCNAPGTFQRCMMAIFHDMIEKTIEVFMDDFFIFGNSFQSCLSHLERMLKRCEDTNLCLNWEKSHFMVKEGIVLSYKISKQGIDVDKAKVDVITKLPYPTTVKGITSFLGHVGFYRHFIKDFLKIARPMTRLLKKDTPFIFSQECIEAFQTLKRKLTEAPLLIALDWDMPFELMCDASDYAIGAVLGQRQDKHFRPIHYAKHCVHGPFRPQISVFQKRFKGEIAPMGSSPPGIHLQSKNNASWSDKLDDALWAFRTAYKTPIGCTPYKLVYRKACHLPVELEHKAYWAFKHANFDLKTADFLRQTQIPLVWTFTISQVYPYGTVELSQPDEPNFKVNGHRVKHYFREDVPKLVVPNLQTFPRDH
uniref:Reverse transcriptase domain-containing protein n=1 Tax=Tanacetum cinerariifolium TaxID=118510 RepID=A0A6L2JP22_TANCI|nr:reverse transcriptase domain-containing protein [Tanacetum cinerariifolium]